MQLNTGSGNVFGRIITRQANGIGIGVNVRANTSQDTTVTSSWLLEMIGTAGSTDAVSLIHAKPAGGFGTVFSWDSLGNSSFTTGTSTLPCINNKSDKSMGLYFSAASTLALSYGTFSVGGGILSSIRTTNASGTSATVNDAEFRLVAVSTTSAQLAWRSGNTTYLFNAIATAL